MLLQWNSERENRSSTRIFNPSQQWWKAKIKRPGCTRMWRLPRAFSVINVLIEMKGLLVLFFFLPYTVLSTDSQKSWQAHRTRGTVSYVPSCSSMLVSARSAGHTSRHQSRQLFPQCRHGIETWRLWSGSEAKGRREKDKVSEKVKHPGSNFRIPGHIIYI